MQQTYRPSTFLGAAVVLALIVFCTVESSGNHSNRVQRSHARRLQRLARVPAIGVQEDANEQTMPESVNRSRSRPSTHGKRLKAFQSVNSEELETLKSSSTPNTDDRNSNDSRNQSKTYQLKKNKSDIYIKSTLLPTTETQSDVQDITTELPTIVTENAEDYITSGGENFGFPAKITQDVTYSTQSSVSKNNSRRKTKHEFHPDENDDIYGYFNSESVSRNSFNSGKTAQNRGRDRHKAKVSDRNANLSEKTLEEPEQIPLKVSRENVYEAPELSNFGTTSIHYTATDSPITEHDRDREDEMLIKATTYSPTTTTLRADLDVSEKPSDSKTTHRRGRYVKIVKHIPAHTLTTDPQYGVEDYTTDSFVTEKFTLEATNSRNGRRRAQRVVKMIRRIPSDKAVHHQDNATETHEVTARQTPNFNKSHRIKKLVKIIRKNITNHETTTLTPSTKIDFLKDSTVSDTETGDASGGESTVEGYFGQKFNKNEISTTLSTFETVTDSDSISTTSFPYVYEGRTRGSRRNNEAHQRRSPKKTSDEQTQRSRSKGKRVLNVIDDENPGTTTTSSVQSKITNNKISNTAEEDFYLGSYSTNTETIEVSTVLDESVHSNIRKREAIESSPTANRRSKPTNSRVGPTENYQSVAGSISSETSRKIYNPIYQRRQIVEYRNSGSKYKMNSERKMTGKVKDVLGNNTENNSKTETTTESQVSDRKHNRNYLKSSVPYSAEPTTETYTTNSTERLNLTEPSDGSVYFMTTQKPINELQTNSVKINSGGKSREYVLIKRSTTLSDNSEEKLTSKTANYINPSTQKAKVQTQLPVSNTVPAVSKNILTVTEPPKETIGSAFRKRLVRLTKLPTINPIFPYKNPTHSSMEITTENTIVSNVKHTANPLTASSTLRHISVLENSTSTTEMSKNKRSDIDNTLIPTGTTEKTIVITQKRFIPSTELPYREKLPSTFGNSITLLTLFSKNNTVFSSKTFPTPSTNSVEQTNSSTTQKPVIFTRELPIYNSNFDTKNSPKNSSLVLTSEHVKRGDLSLSKQNITEINKQKYSKETLKRQEIRKPFNDAGIPREDGSDSTSLTEALTSRAYKVLGALQQVAGAVMEIPKQLWLLPVRFGIYPGIQRTQDEIPQKAKFPCQRGQDTGDGVPTSVHKLRPQDIKVVAALGDSITSANGALANNEEEMRYNYRGVSAMGGGQGTWRRYLTLPNIIKEFNPKLLGYSLGTVETNNPISGLNVAENGAIDDQLLQQAFSLVKKMREDHFIDFNNDWKLVNIMIGGNDICNEYCYQKNDKDSPSGHARQLEDTLTYLKNNLPRTFVNLIHIPNVLTLQNMKNMPIVCHMKHLVLCSCLFGGTERVKGQSVSQMLHGYWEAERRVAEDEKFDTDNFTVVLQPFFLGVGTPDTVSTVFGEVPDLSYFAPDCFHFSQKGNAQVANALWNNMLEPVGNKTEGWEPIMARFNCPSKNAPYIFTRRNSKAYTESGHQ